MVKIRHIESRGLSLPGTSRYAGVAPVKVAILLSAAAVAKSTPWAFGNSEMRYEEKGAMQG
jgi:hypothetical protein